ncbi:6-phospho-beta-glucosidase [Mammaliicoccus fleurettii]|uniref:6-phospho-beta-glucosidase n=1 Tax=Mammaliicoccus fleurettii TaxID=150056 RepID=UPI000E05ABCA|nr:6-phospho-beta-glucosidase [Mammaliicoccus fleurettii]RTX88595.1 6-phospho-beta-glucosidase [Mammaliicoccus fleurettii]SUM37573.1 maltose-6'-phosphate glucosidase [Mammaliicoccus fleurettii]HCN61637.1 6-phospho-beta-glucosidase [Staphylococcus sp.]
MEKGIKIVTIGGGSSYTPELMEGFIKRYESLPLSEIWLVDIPEGQEKLETVGKMAQRMWDASPYDVTIHLSLDRREALKDADFVTTQFRVGLLDARIKDERIPLSHGFLGQETNGPGGIFKALRTIPVLLNIVEDMKELCPNAWLINFTNPSGMVTDAIVRYGKWDKVLGLCNVPVNSLINESEMLNVKEGELTHHFAGLNHFHWHRVKDAQGNDVTEQLNKKLVEDASSLPSNIFDVSFFEEQLQQMNLIPCGYHRYYYRAEEMLEHALKEYHDPEIGTRAEQVRQTEKELFELYKDEHLDHKPEQLSKRGGTHYSDVACETIASIASNKNTHVVVSTVNNGAVPDLAPEDVVEVSAYINATGAQPIAFGSLHPAERGWLQVMKNMELCVEEAAVTGDYGLLLQAFIINPLIQSGETAKQVMNELLIAHKAYLPQFSETIAQLEAQGIEIKDAKARELSEHVELRNV